MSKPKNAARPRLAGALAVTVLAAFLISLPAAERKPPRVRAGTPPAETNTVASLTAAALDSIVVITQSGRDGTGEGVGSGFVISKDGLIATALHVIGEARSLRVRLANGRHCEVTEIHASDRKLDLAILRVEAAALSPLKLGDSDTLQQGAPVIALGNPLGLERSVVQGVVSGRRELDDVAMIQIAMPIEPGNSGGPLLDFKGRVQGILTLKSVMTPNLGFAMPVNLLKTLLEKPNPIPMSRWLTIGALNPKDWTTRFGARWTQRAGRILVEGSGAGFGGRALCLAQAPLPPRPYEVAVRVKLDGESGAAGLVFGADGGDRHYGFYPSAGQLRLTRFDGPNVFSWNILRQVPSPHYKPGEWNHLRVRVAPRSISCYVNGELVVESEDDALPDGNVGLAKFRETRAEFRDFQVGTNLGPMTLESPAPLPDALARRIEKSGAAADPDLASALQPHEAAGRQALLERARTLETEAGQLRRLAAAVHRQAVQAELLKALEGPEEAIDLFQAALLVARLDNADLNLANYHRQVTDMAQEIAARLPAKADDAARIAALTKYLFAENGFHGSRSDYYHKANSYLSAVLDDREGLPITLSILYMELARRLGVKGVAGLPLPGHFMVRFTPREGAVQIIDVFNGGQVLSRTAAQDRVIESTGGGFRDEDERPAEKRAIIVRMLRNLFAIAEQEGSASDALRYQEVLVGLLPDAAAERWQRARMRLQSGDRPGAKEDVKWLLDRQPPGLDVDRLEELYQSL